MDSFYSIHSFSSKQHNPAHPSNNLSREQSNFTTKTRKFYEIIYIVKLFTYIYIFVCMLALAGQTAGPNGLKIFEGTHGCRGSKID